MEEQLKIEIKEKLKKVIGDYQCNSLDDLLMKIKDRPLEAKSKA